MSEAETEELSSETESEVFANPSEMRLRPRP